jgi:hypothetical protein
MTTWTLKTARVIREFEITDAPDERHTNSRRRLVIRPRKVTVYADEDTGDVTSVEIEGQRVRADGELGNSDSIWAGHSTDPWVRHSTPPVWLEKLLIDQRLEWAPYESDLPCDRGYPLGGAHPHTDWCSLKLGHADWHLGVEDGRRFSTSGSVRRGQDIA